MTDRHLTLRGQEEGAQQRRQRAAESLKGN
jgi:hypothetical protein